MTFLIDENLSRRLCTLLADAFPLCRHVADLDLLRTDDALIHARAKATGLVLMSKDDDFRAIVEANGPPPKLVFIKLGNASTTEIATAILASRRAIRTFLDDPAAGIFELA